MAGEIVFVGLGLSSEMDLTLNALNTIKSADKVFFENYTSAAFNFNEENFYKLTKKELITLDRSEIEDKNGESIFCAAKNQKVVFLVVGDPMISTTHTELRIEAKKRGIKTSIIHNASIISAVSGLTGLQNYKFGKSVSIPFVEKNYFPETPYYVLHENMSRSLHTLFFLDIRPERLMDISLALEVLLELERKIKKNLIYDAQLAVGVARAGSIDYVVRCDHIFSIKNFDFGPTPHTLIIPSKLHPIEAEYLQMFAHAPENIL